MGVLQEGESRGSMGANNSFSDSRAEAFMFAVQSWLEE